MLVCSLFLPHFLIYWALLLAVNCQQVHNEENNYDVSLRKSWWGKNITFPSDRDRVGQIQLSFQNFPRRYVSDPSPNCIDKFQQRFGQILDRAPSAGCCQHKLPIRAKCERGTEIAQKMQNMRRNQKSPVLHALIANTEPEVIFVTSITSSADVKLFIFGQNSTKQATLFHIFLGKYKLSI